MNKYFIIYATGNAAALGIFDIALKITMISNGLLNTIAQPLFGVFSNMKENAKKIFAISKKISMILFLSYIIGVCIYYIIGKDIMYFIDNIHFDELYTISLILLIGIGMSGVSEPFYRALLGEEKLKEAFYLKLMVPILNIAIILLMWPAQNLEMISKAYAIAIFSSSLLIIIFSITKYNLIEKT